MSASTPCLSWSARNGGGSPASRAAARSSASKHQARRGATCIRARADAPIRLTGATWRRIRRTFRLQDHRWCPRLGPVPPPFRHVVRVFCRNRHRQLRGLLPGHRPHSVRPRRRCSTSCASPPDTAPFVPRRAGTQYRDAGAPYSHGRRDLHRQRPGRRGSRSLWRACGSPGRRGNQSPGPGSTGRPCHPCQAIRSRKHGAVPDHDHAALSSPDPGSRTTGASQEPVFTHACLRDVRPPPRRYPRGTAERWTASVARLDTTAGQGRGSDTMAPSCPPWAATHTSFPFRRQGYKSIFCDQFHKEQIRVID